MSHNITFKITFLDYWHLGSGQSGGAKYDSSVIKDRQGFPYVPGKTLKGLLREYAEGEFAKVCFGEQGETRGMCYFSNAYIESSIRAELLKHNHQFLLVDSISATKINDKGVAESGSLREIEVVIPLSLYGSIENVPNEFVSLMSAALKKMKRMGLNRTRGKILLVDMYYNKAKGKTFPHIKIDNFTGGGIDGALFQEKVDTLESFKLKIWLEKGIDKTALEAFEHALCDIANGLLALGGASSKGHGYFQGSITKNGENYDTSRF